MQDACQSESAAASISYPSTIILICYFHLKKNVRDRLKGNKKKGIPPTPEQFKDSDLGDITQLHYSRNQLEFEQRLGDVWFKWSKIPELKKFQDYFWTQWVMNAKTNKWQIFHTPRGFASTNNPTESSLNKEIKGTYSNYEQFSMLGVLSLMHKI